MAIMPSQTRDVAHKDRKFVIYHAMFFIRELSPPAF